ncbi:MAG: type II secretion system protein [Candidatus Vogelbacteria bacterium]
MKRGFTLIELLVVIAIIGLLSSIVLASLSKARDKAKDAAIKGDMIGIRSSAALYFSDHGDYGSAFANQCILVADPTSMFYENSILNSIKHIGSLTPAPNVAFCFSKITTNVSYAVVALLNETTSETDAIFCIDSHGTSKTYFSPNGSGLASFFPAPSGPYVCP